MKPRYQVRKKIVHGMTKLRRCRLSALHVKPGLLQSEQLEMIDEERAEQDDQPTRREH